MVPILGKISQEKIAFSEEQVIQNRDFWIREDIPISNV